MIYFFDLKKCKLWMAAFCLIVHSATLSQTLVYPTDELKSDFALFRKGLEEAHPSLYRFHSKNEMDKLFDNAFNSLRQPLSELSFYQKLASIISMIGCGHTAVILSDEYYKNHPVRTARFPFDVKFVADKLFVVKDYTEGKELMEGSELLSVDNISISELISSFFPMINGDGFIASAKYKRLEQYFGRLIQILHKESAAYEIGFRDAKSLTVSKTIKLVPTASIQSENEKPDLDFLIKDNLSTAILTIRTFDDEAMDASGIAYRDFLDNSFSTLKEKKIQSLIIDLRGNGGGRDDFGALLYSYLTNKAFEYYEYLEMKKPEYSFLKYTDKQESYKDEIKDILIEHNGKWIRKDFAHPCLPEQPSQPNNFNGKVLVLIDGNSFSATAEFSSIASYHKRAMFIGEETGGAYEGNTSGGGIDLVLPNTKLHVRIPLTKYVCAVTVRSDQVGRGVIPDKIVTPTLKGMLAGKDEAMEQALLLAKRVK